MEIVSWFVENWLAVVNAVAYVVTAATAIVALTPSPKDDEWLAKIRKVFDFLAGNVLNNK